MKIPEQGRAADDILADLRARHDGDTTGATAACSRSSITRATAHEQLLQQAHALYASANLLEPDGVQEPQAAREASSSRWRAGCCTAASVVGTVTSGGTESILCAVAAYRDRAREEAVDPAPELVVPTTIHPAFDKAAHYFGVQARQGPMSATICRADVRAMAKAIALAHDRHRRVARRSIRTASSIRSRSSASSRSSHGLPLHVDACVGGFMLPWLEQLGRTRAGVGLPRARA